MKNITNLKIQVIVIYFIKNNKLNTINRFEYSTEQLCIQFRE